MYIPSSPLFPPLPPVPRSEVPCSLKAITIYDSNPTAVEAFQTLMDRVDAQPQNQVYGEVDAEDFSILLEQHFRLQKD